MIGVVCEEVDNLSGGRESHGFAAEHQSLRRETARITNRSPRRRPGDLPKSPDLPEDHVTHRHPHLHAQSQNGVIVEMLEDGQPEGREGQRSGVEVGHDESSLVFWVVVLKVVDDVPQKKRLKHLNGFLRERVAR